MGQLNIKWNLGSCLKRIRRSVLQGFFPFLSESAQDLIKLQTQTKSLADLQMHSQLTGEISSRHLDSRF